MAPLITHIKSKDVVKWNILYYSVDVLLLHIWLFCSRNVLYGPDFNDVQRDLALPGVFMASNVDVYNQTTVDDMKKQISVLVLAIERASNILYDDITTWTYQ